MSYIFVGLFYEVIGAAVIIFVMRFSVWSIMKVVGMFFEPVT